VESKIHLNLEGHAALKNDVEIVIVAVEVKLIRPIRAVYE